MAPKHSVEASEPGSAPSKAKHGFRVGPENLPDGPWRRKVTKIKKELIHKAKVKKAYAKIKAREQETAPSKPQPAVTQDDGRDEAREEGNKAEEQLHPTRKLMLADEDKAQANAEQPDEDGEEAAGDGRRRRTRRPGYYDKQLQKADERQQQAQERQEEFRRRGEERAQKLAEREKFKRAMAKTRDRDGNKKLGRESALLLDKVKKMMAQK